MENSKLQLFKNIVENLKNDNECIKLSLNNVHAEGLFSLVVIGKEFGKLTRVFISKNKLIPFGVQLHTHRYPIRLTSIKGKITHHLAEVTEKKDFTTVSISQYEYKSFLNGGFGLKYLKDANIKCSDYLLPNGSTVEMGVEDFHTVSCSKNSIWIVEELGFEKDSSMVLGLPFVIDNLYSNPEMFQINDMCQIVIRELNKIINDYNSL